MQTGRTGSHPIRKWRARKCSPLTVAFRLSCYCGCCSATRPGLDLGGPLLCRASNGCGSQKRADANKLALGSQCGHRVEGDFPSTVPGCTAPLKAAARNRGAPLKHIEPTRIALIQIARTTSERSPPATFYGGSIGLSGDGLPADPLGLIDHIRGAAHWV
jgi:hypothetical protein